MTEPLVFIVIVNWNSYVDTLECIESLTKLQYKNYEIVLVDNGSDNNSVAQLKKRFSNINYISLPHNLGFSGGNNVGIKYAMKNKAEYVLLLNNDTFVDSLFLNKLINTFNKITNVGIVSPMIYYANYPKKIWATGSYENKKSHYGYIDYAFQKQDNGEYQNIQEVDCVWGCSMLISNNVLKKVGLFDEDYFLYAEDIDYCYRVKKYGYKIIFNPYAKIWHKVSASTGGEGASIKDYYNTRNLFLFAWKNLTGIKRYQLFLFLSLGQFVFLLKQILKGKYRHACIILKSLLDGLMGKKGYYNFSKIE